jgi:hypothetical protein
LPFIILILIVYISSQVDAYYETVYGSTLIHPVVNEQQSSPLCYICNKAISNRIFSARLKYSVIRPLFKQGDRENLANYRPISLLTSFSNVFEKVIYRRILTRVTNNNILVNEQFGFLSKLSTERATYNLVNEILESLNNKREVGGIFFDLEKAFDCVNHNVLLSK